jgi:pimeloyl-ACP methyl ester carboxylesterase/predicted glycosyltransferase
MRARYPATAGSVERDGVTVAYEVAGAGGPAVVFVPAGGHDGGGPRPWPAQVAYLAQSHTVVTIGPRGGGPSGTAAGWAATGYAADVLAVMDACGIGQAVLAGHCAGGWHALLAAARHQDRVLGVAVIESLAPALTPPCPETGEPGDPGRPDGPAAPPGAETVAETEAILRQVHCPVLAIGCSPADGSARIAELTGGDLLVLEGAGHRPQSSEPVVISRELAAFAGRFRPRAPAARRTWTRPLDRPPRVLFVTSLAGLGHAVRDLAIAAELRKLRPGLQVHWLAQHPVTELLRRRDEIVHPASARLTSDPARLESVAGEYDLHLPSVVRAMRDLMVSNFMVFADLVRDEPYDLCVGDGARGLDFCLHENPELKRSAYAWLTDFAGWLPMPGSDAAEHALTTRLNTRIVEQLARFPAVRDRSLFIGNQGDVVRGSLGDGLPQIRDWVEEHYQFPGYILGFRPSEVADRDAVRAELGYRPDEQVCVVTVGGTGVPAGLLHRAAAAFPAARRLLPGLRMVLVAGPRIDPATLAVPEHLAPYGTGSRPGGLEVRGFLPGLYRHLAACDLAVTAGGLATTMELTALQRPFLYVPLRRHFEQNLHVRHRLAQYQAGRSLDWDQTAPDELAEAIAAEIGREVSFRPVETDGAARAAASLAELL